MCKSSDTKTFEESENHISKVKHFRDGKCGLFGNLTVFDKIPYFVLKPEMSEIWNKKLQQKMQLQKCCKTFRETVKILSLSTDWSPKLLKVFFQVFKCKI